MKYAKVLLSLLIVGFVFESTTAALAQAVSVEVSIQAVTPESRGITVSYDVGGQKRTATLDVTRKAEITLNGTNVELDSLASGQTATIDYQKGLGVVTKIQATGEIAVASEPVFRLTLHLSEFGEGTFRIEKTSKLPLDDFAGEPFTFSGLPKTKATKGQDGMFRLIHDFSVSDDLDVLALAYQRENVTINGDKGLAVFTPGPTARGQQGRRAVFPYARRVRLPLTVEADLIEHGGGAFALQVFHYGFGMLQCWIKSEDVNLDSPFEVQIGWIEMGESKKEVATTLCGAKGVTLTLYFNEYPGGGTRFVSVTRGDRSSPWGNRQPLELAGVGLLQGLTCPFVTEDGLALFCVTETQGIWSNEKGNLLKFTRSTTDEPFGNPEAVVVPELPRLIGRYPRYVAATKELFFLQAEKEGFGNSHLIILKNYNP